MSLDASNLDQPRAAAPTARGQVTGEREAMLAAMRAAIVTPTNPHVRHAEHDSPPATTARQVLPPVPADWEQRAALFALRSDRLRTAFLIVDDLIEMQKAVARLVAAEARKLSGQPSDDDEADQPSSVGAISLAYQVHPLVSAVIAPLPGGVRVLATAGYDRHAFAACPVGITTCEALVAQTGSVLVSSAHNGGRTASILPPHHIVLATADQLIDDLPSAYELIRGRLLTEGTSMISLITGPSRTGDIERILVLGAHGPKHLTVILQR